MSASLLQHIAVYAPALLLSLSVHEYAHAWVATRLGDRTPVAQGRLTLSPIAHIDPIGTLLVPGVAIALGGLPFFAWAKPVEFHPANFTRKVTMWQGTALAAVAGPVSNLLLAIVAVIILKILVVTGVELAVAGGETGFANAAEMGVEFVTAMFGLNVALLIFNLLPLPPLDGGHLIPRSLEQLKEVLARYSFVILLALLFFGRDFLAPVNEAIRRVLLVLVGL